MFAVSSICKSSKSVVITVVMNEPTTEKRSADTTKMLDYGFNIYMVRNIIDEEIVIDTIVENPMNNDFFSVKCSGFEFSLSGVQNKVQQFWDSSQNQENTAAFALRSICAGVKKATQNARKNYPGLPVVFSGGVAANSMLRSELSEFSPIFCEPQFSTDNAMGVAILAHRCQEG